MSSTSSKWERGIIQGQLVKGGDKADDECLKEETIRHRRRMREEEVRKKQNERMQMHVGAAENV